MNFFKLWIALMAALSLAACGDRGDDREPTAASADWAFHFIVFDGAIYKLLEEQPANLRVGSQIGEIQQFSDHEAIAERGVVFSNKFPAGSKIYAIEGVPVEKAIAVEAESGAFRQLAYESPYDSAE